MYALYSARFGFLVGASSLAMATATEVDGGGGQRSQRWGATAVDDYNDVRLWLSTAIKSIVTN